jgi:hypothetical protein
MVPGTHLKPFFFYLLFFSFPIVFWEVFVSYYLFLVFLVLPLFGLLLSSTR